ncbi:MAG TPA: LamG domain-containing protein, partial [bacterium]|nr:LamG domain-containing protein [bacterium]
TNYVSFRVYDNVNRNVSLTDAFIVKKDTVAPSITNNMSGGDNSWRKTDPGAIYNVDFADNLSYLDTAQYAVYPAQNMQGVPVKGWSPVFTSTNVASYSQNFVLDFEALKSSWNYVSFRSWDMVGSTRTLTDAFYVKKDTIPPSVPGLALPSDNVSLNYSTVSFTWSTSQDTVSGFLNFELEVDDGDSFLTLIYSSATALAQSTFTFSSDGRYYWRVRGKDTAGNYSSWSSTGSFVIDKIAPSFTGSFASKNKNSAWIGQTEWNDNAVPDVRIQVQDTGSGLKTARTEYSPLSDTVFLTHFDEGSGLPQDSSSFGNHAAFNSAAYSSDAAPLSGSSYALDFNGAEYVNCGQDTSLDMDYFTVEAWVKFDSISGNRVIASVDDGTNRRWALYLMNGDTLRFFVFNNNAWVSPDYGWVPQTGVWYHIVGVKGTSVRTYINGLEVGTPQSQPGPVDKDAVDLRIGVGSYPGYFDGRIDEVRITNRALSSEEISAGYSSGYLKYSTNGGSSWSTKDLSISGTNGTTAVQTATGTAVSLKESATLSQVKFVISDMAGNSNESSAYTVKIDTNPPSIVSLLAPADALLSKTSLVNFDWSNSADALSGFSSYTLEVSTRINFPTIYYSSITEPSQVSDSFSANEYWWRVKAKDAVGNYSAYSATRSFTIDLSSPSITNLQGGDSTWRTSNSGSYNVDFTDDNKLDYFQVKAATGLSDLISWTTVVSNIDVSSYSDPWPLPSAIFNALRTGPTNYISVRVYDKAGNYDVLNNAFYVKKDTAPPVISDLQEGDTGWRRINSGVYNIDYSDAGSQLDYAQYRIVSGTGGVIVDWYTYAPGIDAFSYDTDFSLLTTHYSLLTTSFSYVSVRAFDVAGTSTSLTNA